MSAATVYKYGVIVNDVDQFNGGPYPQFKTFPEPTATPSFKFGLLADLNFLADANVAEILKSENPSFVIFLGDYDHRNPGENENVLLATRTMHRQLRQITDDDSCAPTCPGNELQPHIFNGFPVINVWDDHDYCCNNSDGWFTDKEKSFLAHREYWPSYPLANPNREGLWHKFSYGSQVEIYVLDLRYQRADNDDINFCPGGVPSKSMLADFAVTGDDQKTWLKAQLLASTATWKFLISSVPWNRTVEKSDAWRSFWCEQNELLNFIAGNNISGVVVISGDIHTGGAIDDGANAKCPEISVPKTNFPGGTTCFEGPCGTWKCDTQASCFIEMGSGYGVVDVNPTNQTVTLTTKSWSQGVLTTYNETVAATNVCASVP